MKRSFFKTLLIWLYILLLPLIASSEETYEYERMWPVLEQPWYFNAPLTIAIDGSGNVYVADTFNHHIQKFTSNGEFITKWGSSGSGDGQFNSLTGIAVDSSGNVYVADTGNDRIQKFTSNFQFITKWGSSGSGDGQFNSLTGIAVDSSSNAYVADAENHRIQKFTSSGQFIAKWGSKGSGDGQFDSPYGIAIDSSGDVYVADTSNDRIQKFTSGGQFVLKWGSYGHENEQFDAPKGIAVNSSGDVYVGDTADADTEIYCIQKFTSSGQFIAKWESSGSGDGQFDGPESIAVDTSGYVYVADQSNNRIQKFTSNGQFVTKWGSEGKEDGQFTQPFGLAVDSSDNVYVADSENHRIQKFTSSGQFIAKWGSEGSGDGQFDEPHGIAIDGSGNVYVGDPYMHRIQKFTSSGQFLVKWGSEGSGNGQFSSPIGIAVDSSGDVYVADAGNNRIQKFTSDGQFIAKWGGLGSGDGQFEGPLGIAIDGNNNVYVADYNNHRFQKFTSDGQFVTRWGNPGSNPGEFYHVSGIAVSSDGKVYVSDGNNRIQGFSKATLPESVSNPNTPSGPASGKIGLSYNYSTGGSTSNLGHSVEYQFDWKGDGSDLSSWGSASQSKTWTAAGTYNVRARARCSQDVSVLSDWSNSLSVSIGLPDISVTPLTYDFGNVEVKKSKTASFKVKNNGKADLLISPSITGTDVSMFTITSGGVSKTIKPNKTLTIKVVFKPTSAGSKSSMLGITCNDPDTPTIDIPLTGTVPFSEKIPDISVAQTPIDFGNIKVGKKVTKTLKIGNNGTGDLVITLSGLEGKGFSIQGSSSVIIKSKKSYSLKVLFTPKSAGLKIGTLRITSNDSDAQTIDISLSGTGQ